MIIYIILCILPPKGEGDIYIIIMGINDIEYKRY